jgi:hypothetical protein
LSTFPADHARRLIAEWATIRDSCIERLEAWLVVPNIRNAQLVAIFQQEVSIFKEATANIGEQKLTYGEFAQRSSNATRPAWFDPPSRAAGVTAIAVA